MSEILPKHNLKIKNFLFKLIKNNLIKIYRSKAIAAIEKVDKKILKPCNEPTILHEAVPNGQNTNNTVYNVIGAVTVQIKKSESAKFNIKKFCTVRICEFLQTAAIVNKLPIDPNAITIE